MAAKVFAIPELATMVVQYLTPRDISACMSTCRAMREVLHPHFWKHVFVRNPTEKKKIWMVFCLIAGSIPNAFHKNRHLMETINFDIFANDFFCNLLSIRPPVVPSHTPISSLTVTPAPPTSSSAQPDFVTLKSISFQLPEIDSNSAWHARCQTVPIELLASVLEMAPNVTTMHLPSKTISVQGYTERLAKVVEANLPHLKTLTFLGPQESALSFNRDEIPVSSVLRILQACLPKPSLKTLRFSFRMSYHRKTDSPLVTKASKEFAKSPTARSALTDFEFPKGRYDLPTTFVFPIVKTCLPQLEVLNIPHISDQYFGKLALSIRDHCPNVRQIIMNGDFRIRDDTSLSSGMERLVKTCKELKVFKGTNFKLHGNTGAVFGALLQHTRTLETVCYSNVHNDHLETLISTGVALRTLVMDKESPLTVTSAIKADWACRGLRTLHLTMKVMNSTVKLAKKQELDYDMEFNPDFTPEPLTPSDLGYMALRKMFKIIGSLTELEDLYLNQPDHGTLTEMEDGNEHLAKINYGRFLRDWTLGVGLGFLGGLKKLRRWRLDYGLEFIGQAEVEFIDRHWPNLEVITFYGEERHVKRHVHYGKHWTWLQERRPDLQYIQIMTRTDALRQQRWDDF
ncbi:hypothetical protein BGX28_008577 [Mortierella sp. GBA30]|nr:hypothetical protein BGX28_008577 [Mortierella sp. GBA30]